MAEKILDVKEKKMAFPWKITCVHETRFLTRFNLTLSGPSINAVIMFARTKQGQLHDILIQ